MTKAEQCVRDFAQSCRSIEYSGVVAICNQGSCVVELFGDMPSQMTAITAMLKTCKEQHGDRWDFIKAALLYLVDKDEVPDDQENYF